MYNIMKIVKEIFGEVTNSISNKIFNVNTQIETDTSENYIYKIIADYTAFQIIFIYNINKNSPYNNDPTSVVVDVSGIATYTGSDVIYDATKFKLNKTYDSGILNIFQEYTFWDSNGQTFLDIDISGNQYVLPQLSTIEFINNSVFSIDNSINYNQQYKTELIGAFVDNGIKYYPKNYIEKEQRFLNNTGNSITEMIIDTYDDINLSNFNIVLNNSSNTKNSLNKTIINDYENIFSINHGGTYLDLFKLKIDRNINSNNFYQTKLILVPVPLPSQYDSLYNNYLSDLTTNLFQLSYNVHTDPNYIPLKGFYIKLDNYKMFTLNDNTTELPIMINEFPKIIIDSSDNFFIQLKLSTLDVSNITVSDLSQSILKLSLDYTFTNLISEITILDNLAKYRTNGIRTDTAYYTGNIILFKINKQLLTANSLYEFQLNINANSKFYVRNDFYKFYTNNNSRIIVENPFINESNDFYFTANKSVEFELNKDLISNIGYIQIVSGYDYEPNVFSIDLNTNQDQYFLDYVINYDSTNNKINVYHDISHSICYITYGSFYLKAVMNTGFYDYKSKVYTNVPLEFSDVDIPIDNTTLGELYKFNGSEYTDSSDSDVSVVYIKSLTKEYIDISGNQFKKNTSANFPVLWFKNNKLLSSEIINMKNTELFLPMKYDTLNTNYNTFNDISENLGWEHKLFILSLSDLDCGDYISLVKYKISNLNIYLEGNNTHLNAEEKKKFNDQNVYKLFNDNIVNNSYYKGYYKWRNDLTNFAIYIFVVILRIYSLFPNPPSEQLFNQFATLFGSSYQTIKLCDTEKEIAASCGEEFFRVNITNALNEPSNNFNKTFTYTLQQYMDSSAADLTVVYDSNGLNIFDVSGLKPAVINQLIEYVRLSQVAPNFANYKNFKIKSQELLDIYDQTVSSINSNFRAYITSANKIDTSEMIKAYSDVFNSILDLYDEIKKVCDVSTTTTMANIYTDFNTILNTMKNQNLTDPPFNNLSTALKGYLTQIKTYLNNNPPKILEAVAILYTNVYSDPSLFNEFMTVYLPYIGVTITQDDIDIIKNYFKWLTTEGLKIAYESLSVGVEATALKYRLESALSGHVTTYEARYVEKNKKGSYDLGVDAINGADSSVSVSYSYKNIKEENVNESAAISVTSLIAEDDHTVDTLSDTVDTIVSYNSTYESITDYWYTQNQTTRVYLEEPTTNIAIPEQARDPVLRINPADITNKQSAKKQVKSSDLNTFMIANGLDNTQPVLLVTAMIPDDTLTRQINVNADPDYIPVKITINNGQFAICEGSCLDLTSGSYFIVLKKIQKQTYSNVKCNCLTGSVNVLTPNGYVNVKDLKNDDLIITSNNDIVPIVRIYKSLVTPPPYNSPFTIPAYSLAQYYPPENIILTGTSAVLMSNESLIPYQEEEWFIPNHYKDAGKFRVRKLNITKQIYYYHIVLPDYINDNLVLNGGCIVDSIGRKKYGVHFIKKSNGLFKRVYKN